MSRTTCPIRLYGPRVKVILPENLKALSAVHKTPQGHFLADPDNCRYVAAQRTRATGAPMAYPEKFTPGYSYTAFEQSQGDGSFPGDSMDGDLANVARATNETIDFLRATFTVEGVLLAGALPNAADLAAYTAQSAASAVQSAASATQSAASAAAALASQTTAGTSSSQAASSATAAAGSASAAAASAAAAAVSAAILPAVVATQYLRGNAAGTAWETRTQAQTRTDLGLVPGVDVQVFDADLAAIAALTSAADRLPYSTGAGTWALATFTAAGRALVDDADAAAQRTTLGLVIGTNVQAADSDLTAIAALASAADQLPYATGASTWAMTTLTAAGRALIDDTNAAAQRTTLGLLDMATQGSSAVAITGGTLAGITSAAITGGSISGLTTLLTGGATSFQTRSSTVGVNPIQEALGTNANAGMLAGRFSADASSPKIFFAKSRGTSVGAYAAINSNDALGELSFGGSDATKICEGARIAVVAEAVPGADYTPSSITFSTAVAGGAAAPTEKVRITAAGDLQMGGANTVVSSLRHLQLRSYTVATLPSAATAAQMIWVSDGLLNNRVATSNGTNWVWLNTATVVS